MMELKHNGPQLDDYNREENVVFQLKTSTERPTEADKLRVKTEIDKAMMSLGVTVEWKLINQRVFVKRTDLMKEMKIEDIVMGAIQDVLTGIFGRCDSI